MSKSIFSFMSTIHYRLHDFCWVHNLTMCSLLVSYGANFWWRLYYRETNPSGYARNFLADGAPFYKPWKNLHPDYGTEK